MIKKASQLRDWLISKRFFRVGWVAKDNPTVREPEEAFSTLPDEIAEKLHQVVNQLPANPFETQAVLDPLESAIAQWVEDPTSAESSIVITAQPVSPVSLVLGESLSQIKIEENHQIAIELVDWIERPPHSDRIREKLEKRLTSAQPKHQEEQPGAKQITIIPNLGWCFLRSARGLDGIDYLQDSIMNDSSQFVVIGCGQIGWEYLKSTLKLQAYCDQVVHLPELTGKQLQEWIEPIVNKFDIQFQDAALHKRLSDSNQLEDIQLSIKKPIETISEITQEAAATAKSSLRSAKEALDGDADDDDDTSPKREYFNRLAEISNGVSIVAIQLFVKSLRYQKTAGPNLDKIQSGEQNEQERDLNSEETSDRTLKDSSKDAQIVAQIPKLPPLPEDLSQSDLYLLYSLMLHGDLTIKALAESLGDAPQIVNNQVQVLRKQGIIEQKGSIVKPNPIHYPKLKRELANNNFIIEAS